MFITKPQTKNVLLLVTLVAIQELFIYIRHPWFFTNQMWAEMGSDFVPTSMRANWLANLFATESGYSPFLQRIFAQIYECLKIPIDQLPSIYNQTGIILSAVMVGSILSDYFSDLISKRELRFLLACTVLFVAPDFETRTFINFTYFAALPLMLIAAKILKNKATYLPNWIWFLLAAITSKPLFIVFTAIFCVLALRKGTQRSFKIFTTILFSFSVLQVIQLTSAHGEIGKWNSGTTFNPAKLFAIPLYFFGEIGRAIELETYATSTSFAIVIGFIALAGAFIAATKLGSEVLTRFPISIVSLFVVALNIAFNALVLDAFWKPNLDQLSGAPINRHVFFAFCGLLAALIEILAFLVARLNSKQVELVAALTGIVITFVVPIFFQRVEMSPMVNNSYWQLTRNLYQSELSPKCIPIDPLGWTYGTDCRQIQTSMTWNDRVSFSKTASSSPQHLVVMNPRIPGQHIAGIGVVMDTQDETMCKFKLGLRPDALEITSSASESHFPKLVYFQIPSDLQNEDFTNFWMSGDCVAEVGTISGKSRTNAIIFYGWLDK